MSCGQSIQSRSITKQSKAPNVFFVNIQLRIWKIKNPMSKSLLPPLYNTTINFILRQEVEVKILIVFSFFFLIGLLKVGQICIPSFQSGKFAFDHYTLPLLFGSLVILCVSKKNWRQVILIFLFLVVSVYFHFNFKSWAPIINPNNYDQELQYLDVILMLS